MKRRQLSHDSELLYPDNEGNSQLHTAPASSRRLYKRRTRTVGLILLTVVCMQIFLTFGVHRLAQIDVRIIGGAFVEPELLLRQRREDNATKNESLPLCPPPETFSNCTIEVQGFSSRDPTRAGFVRIDSQVVFKWWERARFMLFVVSSKCQLLEMKQITETTPIAVIEGYINKHDRGTTLVGVSGEDTLQQVCAYSNVFEQVGIEPDSLGWQETVAFVSVIGFPGFTKTERVQNGAGPLVWSTGISHGRSYKVSLDDITYTEAESKHSNLIPGGYWRPSFCTARWRLAVVVPYRNRERHLRPFLNNIHGFLQKQLLEYAIYIVEQAEPELFNRGALLNIGFLESRKERPFNCFAYHDVDLIPEDLTNLYHCSELPRHLAVARSQKGYKMAYGEYFGGVELFKAEHLLAMNGFTNEMFGWGTEDDDAFNRLQYSKLSVLRYPPEIGRYTALSHNLDATNPKSGRSRASTRMLYDTYRRDGIWSVRYKRIGLERRPLYTWIYVKLNGPSDEAGIIPHWISAQARLKDYRSFLTLVRRVIWDCSGACCEQVIPALEAATSPQKRREFIGPHRAISHICLNYRLPEKAIPIRSSITHPVTSTRLPHHDQLLTNKQKNVEIKKNNQQNLFKESIKKIEQKV